MSTITTTTVGDSMLPRIISQTAVLQLAQYIVSTRTTTRLFGGRREGEKYIVPSIVGDGSRTRSIGGSVTASTNTVADIEIPVFEEYYTVDMDRRFLDSDAGIGAFAEQFISNGVVNLANGVESKLWQQVANQNGLGAVSTYGSGNLTITNFNDAMIAMGNIGTPMQDRHLVSTWVQNTKLMDVTAFPEFSQYQIGGLPNTQTGGVPGYSLRGFNPSFTGNLYRNAVETTDYTALLNEALDATETAIDIDTISVSGAVQCGDIWTIGTEQMLVVAVPTTAWTTSGTFTVVRGWNSTTAAVHADNDPIAAASGYQSFFFQRNDVAHVFAPILVPRQMSAGYSMAVSSYALPDGKGSLDLGVIQEPILGTNGGARVSMFTVCGMQAIRPAAVIRAVTSA